MAKKRRIVNCNPLMILTLSAWLGNQGSRSGFTIVVSEAAGPRYYHAGWVAPKAESGGVCGDGPFQVGGPLGEACAQRSTIRLLHKEQRLQWGIRGDLSFKDRGCRRLRYSRVFL